MSTAGLRTARNPPVVYLSNLPYNVTSDAVQNLFEDAAIPVVSAGPNIQELVALYRSICPVMALGRCSLLSSWVSQPT